MAIDFDYAAARQAGYTDDQILKGLKEHGELDFDVDAALKKYSAGDILQGILPKPKVSEPAPEPSGIMGRVKDIGISALKSAINVPEMAVGLGDIVSGGAIGRGAEAIGFRPAEAKATLNDFYTPEQKAANQRVADAKGFLPTVGAMLENPSTIVQTGVESLASMGAGGVVGRGALALAPKIGAALAGAVGEGVVGAGQTAEQVRQQTADGSLSLGQAGAALASGIGTGAFAAVGGRIAHKLGIADIDTALVQAGAAQASSKGVARRMLEGGVSEGVFEELPQSIQEQMWQNAAMGKPLLDGVPENAAQGLIAGGLFGGIAGGALHGKPQATVTPDQPGAPPLLLEHRPDPFLSFPDGSVGRRSDAEAFINNLPEEQREAARARLFGGNDLTPQPVTPEDVMASQSIDEAIVRMQQSVDQGSPEFQAQRNADIDSAWSQHLTERATQRQAEFQLAEDQRRAAETPQLLNQVADQRVAQADALTGAQGFDSPEPTAMQIAMQEAQARRAAATAEAQQAATIASPQQGENDGIRQGMDGREPGDSGVYQDGIQNSQAGAERSLAPSLVPQATPNQQDAPSAQRQSTQAQTDAAVAQAKTVLTAAGVTGNERMAALRSIRTGENTIEDLVDAHPPKAQEVANEPTGLRSGLRDERVDGAEAAAAVQQRAAPIGEVVAQPADSGEAAAAEPTRPAGEGVVDAAAQNTDAALSKVSGRKIDADWTEFARQSGTLGIGRDQMPQVQAAHRGALVNYLGARGITHETTEVPAGDLKPTQREFSASKVQQARDYEGGDRSILVSSDNYILDGHHQWLAKLDANEPVKVIRLDAPIRELLAEVHDFPSSQVAEGAKAARTDSLSRDSSWVIRDKKTGEVVMETFDKKKVDALNTEKYEAVPVQQHLGESNTPGTLAHTVARGEQPAAPATPRTPVQSEVDRLRAARDARIEAQRNKPKTEAQRATDAKYARQEAEIAKARENAERRQAERDGQQDDAAPRKSEADTSGSMTAADVNKAITALRAKWLGFTKVNTVQSIEDIPADIRERAQADGQTEGFYDPQTKSVYLIADNIASPARAAWVAAHEVIGHGGLRQLHDKSVNEALNIAGANKFVKELAAAIQQDRGNVSASVALEEALAEMAAATEQDDFAALEDRYGVKVPAASRNGVIGAVARVYEAVKRFLASVTGRPVSQVSDADVRALIGEQQAAVEGREAPDRQSSERGVLASVKEAVTNTPAFKRWFGKSKVVDENGNPLVVYHGTSGGHTEFSSNYQGSVSSGNADGFWFSKSKEYAWEYAENAAGKRGSDPDIYRTFLRIENPLTVTFNDNGQPVVDGEVKDWNDNREVVDYAKANGFDGINWATGSFTDDPSYTVFRPNQIKSASDNNGKFSTEENSILQSRAQATVPEEVIPKWAEGQPDAVKNALRKSGAIYTEETFKQKVAKLKEGALKKLQYGILDQFAPIKDQLGKIPYVMARMAKNADGTLEALMLYGRPHLDADGGMLVDTTKKGFIETMQVLNGEHDRFFSWLAGRRAEQLKKEGRENLFTDADISALSTLNQGQMKDGTSREATYLRAQKDVAELNKSVLDIAEQSGLIDGESRKVWASDFYVPFYRVMEEGVTGPSVKSGLVNQKTIKKLKGGTNNLGDLTQNMLMNWSTLLTASAKNRAAKASLDAATAIGVATEADEATIRAMGKSASTKAVSYMENGANRWHVVEDDNLLAAITALEFNGYNNQAMRVMQKFKNYLTLAVTVMPGFKVRNLIRDSISSIAVAQAGYNPLANLKNGYSLLRDEDARAQLVAGGGIYRFGTYMEGNRAENVKRLIDSGVADDTILNTTEKMAGFVRKLWSGYQEAGDFSENLNRAALYKKLREDGKSHLEASFEALDLMDFGLSGAWAGVRALNQVLPFFNARLQGLYKLGRGYNDDPRRMGYVVGAVALASVALMLAYKDDDDFKKRSESDRNNYWWFKVGGIAYRIPRPFEIGAAGSAIEHLTALMLDSENTNAKRFGNQMAEIINGQLAMNPIPQVFRPLVDVYANKDAFTGRPIENMAMQRLKPEDRYTYNTSELARMLSKSGVFVDPVGLVAGTGSKQLSPVQIDSLIKGYFSGMGTLATAAVDGLLHHSVIDRGEALPATIKTFAGSFAESLPTNSSRYVDMLYSSAQDIEQSYASYRNAIKNGDIEKARQIMKDEGGQIAKYHLVESLKKNESKINQQIQRTMNSKELTGEQKAETIRRLKVEQDKIARLFATRA